MNRYLAAVYLETCGRGVTPLASLYDDDAKLREALSILIPGFEYPDWSHKTLIEVRSYLACQSDAPVWPEVIARVRESIGAGGLSEHAAYERGIVEPYLDVICDELSACPTV